MAQLPILSSSGSLSPSRLDREVGQQVGLARAAGSVLAAREVARVEAVAQVTEAALLATSHVSALEGLLLDRTPHAEGRLRHIADAGCAGMANVVLGMARRG